MNGINRFEAAGRVAQMREIVDLIANREPSPDARDAAWLRDRFEELEQHTRYLRGYLDVRADSRQPA